MNLTAKLATPGEHPIIFTASPYPIEGIISIPEHPNINLVALLGHPHPLYGGTMHNKVVTTMAKAFAELNIPSVRFNFRGVGKSEGVHDNGIKESEDMLTLIRHWQDEQKNAKVILAGFSFGSYVAYRAAARCQPRLLLTIAPPVNHYDYHEFHPQPKPWLIVQGQQDEIVPAQEVLDFAQKASPTIPTIVFDDTGHFFHGKLLTLRTKLTNAINEYTLRT